MSADRAAVLSVSAESVDSATVIVTSGLLDRTSYRRLRDIIIKAALDVPRAVIVDVTELSVPAESAWAVFTSARWHVTQWPEVPILLVCAHGAGRDAITRNGIARYVPVYPTSEEAITTLHGEGRHRLRRRARLELPADRSSVELARAFVADRLTQWGHTELIAIAGVVATVFVENVLTHTESTPSLRLESDGAAVTVAVEDNSGVPPERREDPLRGTDIVSGLSIVAAMCRFWGTAPTSTGKTVWAVIGPENEL
ncbi:ATP-binding protein [soil metagenome]